MTNPFDASDGTFYVLANEEDQLCLWPTSIDVPAGWSVTHGPTDRDACIGHVNATWTDLRPRSFVEQVRAAS